MQQTTKPRKHHHQRTLAILCFLAIATGTIALGQTPSTADGSGDCQDALSVSNWGQAAVYCQAQAQDDLQLARVMQHQRKDMYQMEMLIVAQDLMLASYANLHFDISTAKEQDDSACKMITDIMNDSATADIHNRAQAEFIQGENLQRNVEQAQALKDQEQQQ